MFFFGPNLKHFHETCSVLELLIFFWLISYYIEEILYINTNSKGNQSRKKYKQIYIFTCLWYWCWKILFFLCRVKIHYQQLLIFLSFMNTFLKVIKGALSGLRQFLPAEISFKKMKNAFYFSLKSQLKIFILTFWSCEKTAWLER